MTHRTKILFLVRQLEIGGAERQLLTLTGGLDPARFDVHVAAMYAGGQLEPAFRALPHVTVHSLDKSGRWDLVGFLARLLSLTRRIRPDIVHGYMSGANELALLAARVHGARAIWGIRVSDLDPSRYVWSVGAVFRFGAMASRSVDLIIANSERGRAFHTAAGYAADRFIVIPNGIDTERFAPSVDARVEWRRAHDIAPNATLLLLPARLDPMKDHPTFLKALASVRDMPNVTAICIGDGPATLRDQYIALAKSLGIGPIVRFLDAQRDVQRAYAAADVVVLASAFGEGFPNVLGEAMSCGRACITTRVGDAAVVLGDESRVVEPGDVTRLGEVLRTMLLRSPEQREELGTLARARIVSEFSIPTLVARSSAAFESLSRDHKFADPSRA
jgi:glycosyltransferase involved in cell wall biosynthesis